MFAISSHFGSLPYKLVILLTSKDEVYINDKTKNFINFMGNELKNESCIYNFTEDLSIPYLLKKPSCTKYFSPWLASGRKLENDYINILKKINPLI